MPTKSTLRTFKEAVETLLLVLATAFGALNWWAERHFVPRSELVDLTAANASAHEKIMAKQEQNAQTLTRLDERLGNFVAEFNRHVNQSKPN